LGGSAEEAGAGDAVAVGGWLGDVAEPNIETGGGGGPWAAAGDDEGIGLEREDPAAGGVGFGGVEDEALEFSGQGSAWGGFCGEAVAERVGVGGELGETEGDGGGGDEGWEGMRADEPEERWDGGGEPPWPWDSGAVGDEDAA
jgi:hypothetical protein